MYSTIALVISICTNNYTLSSPALTTKYHVVIHIFICIQHIESNTTYSKSLVMVMSTCNWDDKVLSNRWDLQAYLPDILEIYISVGSSVIISHDTVEAIECE